MVGCETVLGKKIVVGECDVAGQDDHEGNSCAEEGSADGVHNNDEAARTTAN